MYTPHTFNLRCLSILQRNVTILTFAKRHNALSFSNLVTVENIASVQSDSQWCEYGRFFVSSRNEEVLIKKLTLSIVKEERNRCFRRFWPLAHGRQPREPHFHGPIGRRMSKEDKRNLIALSGWEGPCGPKQCSTGWLLRSSHLFLRNGLDRHDRFSMLVCFRCVFNNFTKRLRSMAS